MKKKWYSVLWNIILSGALALAAVSALGTALFKHPFLMTAVYSNSMVPGFQRGDMLFVQYLSKTAALSVGDVIVFKVDGDDSAYAKRYVVHRILGGDEASGYITKGDANDYGDQELGQSPRIAREWVVGRIPYIGGHALKIPYAGYLPIWMEELQKSPYFISGGVVVLALILGTGGKTRKKKAAKGKAAGSALLFFLGGLVLSAMLGVSMIVISQHITLVYDVSAKSRGVLQGSDTGILMPGDTVEQPLAEMSNKSLFPVIVAVTANDAQLSLNHQKFVLKPGESAKVSASIHALQEGAYRSPVHVGMFYPFLPTAWVYALASAHYILAVAAVALVPGLPIMLFPLFDAKMRGAVIRRVRCVFRRGWA